MKTVNEPHPRPSRKDFKVAGMHCASCDILLRDSFKEAGIKVFEVSHKKGMVSVEYDGSMLGEAAIKAIIKKEGYAVQGG